MTEPSRLEAHEISEAKLGQIVDTVRCKRIPFPKLHGMLYLGKMMGAPVDFNDWRDFPTIPFSRDLSVHIRAGLKMGLFQDTPEGLKVTDRTAKRQRNRKAGKLQERLYKQIWRNNSAKADLTAQDAWSIVCLSAGMLFCLSKGIWNLDMVAALAKTNAARADKFWGPAKQLTLQLLKSNIQVIAPSMNGQANETPD